jgi:hypothetical protein
MRVTRVVGGPNVKAGDEREVRLRTGRTSGARPPYGGFRGG